ncbi:serine/threonine-protein kinase HAL4/sat4 [Linnemannia hyalina]|uniref:non-specific serine/threonine protein kinase n=1 Tax=Linnemannia hyalina TaxID=64524 RepID=A0A9P7XQX0_9FUNG|nr:serine/threonine-protein kinase HAL4/sat4 [Linnemannia hyalina]
MSFHVPSEKLDFAIYGDANTNQLQLSPSQYRLLQKQRLDIANAVAAQENTEEGGPDLTGYHSGLFDPSLGRKPHREVKKKQASVVFADLPRPSSLNTIESLQQRQAQQQRPRKLASRHGSIKIDTSLETIHTPFPSRSTRINASVQQPNRLQEHEQQQQRRSYRLERQSQSSPNLASINPVTDQGTKEEREQDDDKQNHTPTVSVTPPAATTGAGVVGSDISSRSQQIPYSSSSSRHPRRHPFSTSSSVSSSSHSHKHHATTNADNHVSEEEEDVEEVVQSLEMVQSRLESGDGLFLDPEEERGGSSVLWPLVAQSATIISTTSSSGRPRLTHRLSYLAHLQDLEADEDDDIPLPALVGVDPTPSIQSVKPSPVAAFDAPASAPVLSSAPMTTQTSSTRQTSLPVKQSVPPPSHPPTPALQSKAPPHSKSVGTFAQKPPISQSSRQPAAAPPIPKLYKRLLRVFKPPTDSSDSEHGEPSTQSPTVSFSGRGPFGLPSNPNSHSSGGGSKSAPSSKRPSLFNAPPQAPAVLPSLANIAKAAPHKTPESSSGGFRARFLRKLMSSPNLNASVYPASSNSTPSSRVDLTQLNVSLATLQPQGVGDQLQQPSSPYSPLPSDFEHDQSCPAGQRMMERRSAGGGRPRSATTSRVPAPMPTLQSKYGVPGRELGAGTQAQVMLLRVKSSKHRRSPKNKDVASWSKPVSTSSPSSSAKHQKQKSPLYQQRDSLSPVDQELGVGVGDSLLAPYARTGTMMTTTEDEVTPEQREAYRKRLLRRTSTGGLSMTNGGGLIYAIKKFRPPRDTETHRQFLKKVCAEFCISTSMDHENIIRTLDLVRDQPGQELVDDEMPQKESRHHHRHHRGGHHQHKDECDYDEDEDDYFKTEKHRREEARDCSCPRSHHRRVRTVKSAGDIPNHGHAGSSASGSSSPSNKNRPIARKSVISKPQRKRSIDALAAARRSIVGHPDLDRSVASHPVPSESSGHRHRHLNHWRGDAHHVSSPSSQEKKKQQQQYEQDLRQKEVQRLRQQRQREKQQAKQLRLDQFPEYCMVMEFAAGGDLFNLLTNSHPPISLHEKHCLWRQLINGVQYMHSMGVAHRDLKPENILIDGTGRILKITDFGIANVFKSVGDPIPLPCRGIIGSEPYIAPEEFYQEEYDPRAVDVWACGIIFYVMYYAAMPWARADRKKDARFNRFITDIVNHRHSEAQRRLQYERRQLHHHSLCSSTGNGGGVRVGSVGSGNTRSGSGSGSVDAYSRPHEVSHLPQYPPYNPNQHQHQHQHQHQQKSSSVSSSRSGSPTETPQSSVDNSPVSSKPVGPLSSPDAFASSPVSVPPSSSTITTITTTTTTAVPPAVYNTFAYNNYLGGHEFIDRIEIPGCRRILYAILEPNAHKRVTIDQVLADDWVSKIRHCTDNFAAQEEQACLVFGRHAVAGLGGGGENYLCLPNGEMHHRHAVPKKVKTT